MGEDGVDPARQGAPQVDLRCGEHGWTLTLHRDLAHAPEAVWAILTEPSLLPRWTACTPDRHLGTAGAVTLRIAVGDSTDTRAATVIRADPPSLLEYAWPDDRFRWELHPTAGGGTRLTLGHTFTAWEWAAEVAAGWHLSFDAAERLLDPSRGTASPSPAGSASPSPAGTRSPWQDLRDAYARRLIDLGWHDIEPRARRRAPLTWDVPPRAQRAVE